jgi:hypothetical protein
MWLSFNASEPAARRCETSAMQQWRKIIRKGKLVKELDKSCGLVSMRLNLLLGGVKPAQTRQELFKIGTYRFETRNWCTMLVAH